MSHKKISHIYTGDDSRSHFEDLIVPMNELIAGERISLSIWLVPTTGVSFRENPPAAPRNFTVRSSGNS